MYTFTHKGKKNKNVWGEKSLVNSSRLASNTTIGNSRGRLKLTSSEYFSDRNSASLRGGLSTATSVGRGVESFCPAKEVARCCFDNRAGAVCYSPEVFLGNSDPSVSFSLCDVVCSTGVTRKMASGPTSRSTLQFWFARIKIQGAFVDAFTNPKLASRTYSTVVISI